MLLAYSTFVLIESLMLVIQGIVLSLLCMISLIHENIIYMGIHNYYDLFLVGAVTQPLALVCFLPITDAIRRGANPIGLPDRTWLNAFSHTQSKSTTFLYL